MPRARLFMNEIWTKSIKNYVGMPVMRLNGLFVLTNIDGLGSYYHPFSDPKKQEIFSATCKGFYTINAYVPDFDEDEQYREVHIYAWEEALRFLPKNEQNDKLFIAGLHRSAPYLFTHIDNHGFVHINARTRKTANELMRANPKQDDNRLSALHIRLAASGIGSIDPESGTLYI